MSPSAAAQLNLYLLDWWWKGTHNKLSLLVSCPVMHSALLSSSIWRHFYPLLSVMIQLLLHHFQKVLVASGAADFWSGATCTCRYNYLWYSSTTSSCHLQLLGSVLLYIFFCLLCCCCSVPAYLNTENLSNVTGNGGLNKGLCWEDVCFNELVFFTRSPL